MIGPELGRDSRSRGADALHLIVIGLPGRGLPLGAQARASASPALPAADLDRGQPRGVARCRNGRAARHGADGCASAPGDTLGILTEAILAGERDSGAIGQQNVITASNSASHPWRIR